MEFLTVICSLINLFHGIVLVKASRLFAAIYVSFSFYLHVTEISDPILDREKMAFPNVNTMLQWFSTQHIRFTPSMEAYSVIHVTLLTYIRSTSYVLQQELSKVLLRIIQAIEPESPDLHTSSTESKLELLDKYISAINSKINPTGFRIVKYRSQLNLDIYYVFVNAVSDSIAKANTNYSAPEIDAIKRIIDDILDQSDFSYSLGYVNSSQRISQTLNKPARESNVLLNRLIDEGWFELTEENRLVLSIRTICELKHYLVERYGLYKDGEGVDGRGKLFMCHQCKELVTVGFKCKETECHLSFHGRCMDFYKRSNADSKCPNFKECSSTWNDEGGIPKRLGVLPQSLV